MRLGSVTAGAVALACACGTPAPAPSTPTPAIAPAPIPSGMIAGGAPYTPKLAVLEPPAGTGGLPGEHRVAARIFAFSDSQLHYMYGKRTFAQSPFADLRVEVAVRPAAQDDGSDLLLGVFADEYRALYDDHALVFLGDAADLSCEQEYDAFFGVLASAGIDRVMSVTSNHDGFYVGNFTSRNDCDGQLVITDMPDEWTRACSEPGSLDDHRLTKGRSVARLAEHLPESPAGPTDGKDWQTEAVWKQDDEPDDYRDAYLYYVRPLGGGDEGVAPAWGVFLDTVDYRGFDLSSTEGAGTVGSVSREQLKFLDIAMFNARTGGDQDVEAFVAFGHHPFAELDKASRKRFERFLDVHPRIVAYVSAHQHISKERSIALPSGRVIPELLVGSTTDAPQHARRLEVHIGDDGAAALASWRLALDSAALCESVESMAADSFGYTGYRILRDGVGIPDIGTIDKLMVFLGLDNLAGKRIVQGIGALLIENELVRSWAKLYLDAPFSMSSNRAALESIVADRYAVGDDFGALKPWLTAKAKPPRITEYDRWQDPAIARRMVIAQEAMHRFGPHRAAFAELREMRSESPETWTYFLCHAVHASEAEERSRRTVGEVTYVR